MNKSVNEIDFYRSICKNMELKPLKISVVRETLELCDDFDNAVRLFAEILSEVYRYNLLLVKHKDKNVNAYHYWENKEIYKLTLSPKMYYLIDKLFWKLEQDGIERFYRWYKQAKRYLKENYLSTGLDY